MPHEVRVIKTFLKSVVIKVAGKPVLDLLFRKKVYLFNNQKEFLYQVLATLILGFYLSERFLCGIFFFFKDKF